MVGRRYYPAGAVRAPAAHIEAHRHAHFQALRTAAEIALLVSGLVVLGLLSTHPLKARNWDAAGADRCVFLGRAGSSCDAHGDKAPAKSDQRRDCEFLGRAGRYCPDAGR